MKIIPNCFYWIWMLYICLQDVARHVNGQDNKVHEAVLCSNTKDNYTIVCDNPTSELPTFINILEVPRLVYSEVFKGECPKTRADVMTTCESQTTTPVNKCHTKMHCLIAEKDIMRLISFRNCHPDFPRLPDGVITANIIIIKYTCFQVSVPRDIVLESSYVEREYPHQTFQQINIFSPGFPDSISPEPQVFKCVLRRIPSNGERPDAPASVQFAFRHLVGDKQCDQKLNLSDSLSFCSSQIKSFNFIVRHQIIRFQDQMNFTYEQMKRTDGGKMWLELKSNVSLQVLCNQENFTQKITTTSKPEIIGSEIPESSDKIHKNNDTKYYYIIGGVFVFFLIMLITGCLILLKNRKGNLPKTPQNRNYNIYSETPPNRKLVRSRVFNTEMTDGNANVVPTSNHKDSHEKQKEPSSHNSSRQQLSKKGFYDRIRIGRIRWILPGKRDQSYEDVGGGAKTFNRQSNGSMKTNTVLTLRPNDIAIQEKHNENYENPNTFRLQSYENIECLRQSKKKPTVSPEETVMQENDGLYECVETNA